MLQESIVEAIKSVNESLKTYEAEWISLKRSPYADKERIHSLRQFIECRLNMEFICQNYENTLKISMVISLRL